MSQLPGADFTLSDLKRAHFLSIPVTSNAELFKTLSPGCARGEIKCFPLLCLKTDAAICAQNKKKKSAVKCESINSSVTIRKTIFI